jgi:hypothetical protein
MNIIEEKILQNSQNLNLYFQINEIIESLKDLKSADKEEFKIIWNVATDKTNWEFVDDVIGCKITHKRLKETFDLSDNYASILVRVALNELRNK